MVTVRHNPGLHVPYYQWRLRFDALTAVRNAQLGHLDRLPRLGQLWLDSTNEPEPGRRR